MQNHSSRWDMSRCKEKVALCRARSQTEDGFCLVFAGSAAIQLLISSLFPRIANADKQMINLSFLVDFL